ncbi:MAG: hypothetical protein VB085_08920 [Peptococcaceae bacterium]|nr:hypothetical protein [Peptococcaceae bacterium]
MAPFCSKTKRVAPEEEELLDFLRFNYHSPEINNQFGDGLRNYFVDRLSALYRKKNSLIDQGISGKEFDELIYRIATLEMFSHKWNKLINAYMER